MKVFISWSGERSRRVATALREWLPLVLHYVEPWMSEADIGAGDRWNNEIGKELQDSQQGIICLTRDNLAAPWILFEAGALAKSVTQGAVCPFLFDVDFGEILNSPLGQFQAKKCDRDSTLQLIHSLNQRASTPVATPNIDQLFGALWPVLSEKLATIPAATAGLPQARQQHEILEDLVSAVRNLEQRFTRMERAVPNRSRAHPQVSESEPIRLRVSGDLFEDEREDFEIAITPSNAGEFVEQVANALTLDAEGFNKTWFLFDTRRKRPLSASEARNVRLYPHLGSGVGAIEVTNLPF